MGYNSLGSCSHQSTNQEAGNLIGELPRTCTEALGLTEWRSKLTRLASTIIEKHERRKLTDTDETFSHVTKSIDGYNEQYFLSGTLAFAFPPSEGDVFPCTEDLLIGVLYIFQSSSHIHLLHDSVKWGWVGSWLRIVSGGSTAVIRATAPPFNPPWPQKLPSFLL